MRIRAATVADLPALQDIERAAGQSFREIGMLEIADDQPPSTAQLARYQHAGRAWVALGEAGQPVGYLIAEPVDGNLHIEQVSVHPDCARRGIGRHLLEHVAAQAAVAGLPALTLTTFTHVPWNAPYYRRLGFRTVTEREISPGLREIRAREADQHLDRWPRVCAPGPVTLH